jgi:hypothetical protein
MVGLGLANFIVNSTQIKEIQEKIIIESEKEFDE